MYICTYVYVFYIWLYVRFSFYIEWIQLCIYLKWKAVWEFNPGVQMRIVDVAGRTELELENQQNMSCDMFKLLHTTVYHTCCFAAFTALDFCTTKKVALFNENYFVISARWGVWGDFQPEMGQWEICVYLWIQNGEGGPHHSAGQLCWPSWCSHVSENLSGIW